MVIGPVVLEGRHVRLESLSLGHHPQLCEVGLDEELWRWTTSQMRTAEEMRAYIEEALAAQAAGTALPFAIVAKEAGRAVGSQGYGNLERAHRRVEIGGGRLGGAGG